MGHYVENTNSELAPLSRDLLGRRSGGRERMVLTDPPPLDARIQQHRYLGGRVEDARTSQLPDGMLLYVQNTMASTHQAIWGAYHRHDGLGVFQLQVCLDV